MIDVLGADESSSSADGRSAICTRTSRRARIPVKAVVILHADSRPVEATTCDVSEAGLKIETNVPLPCGPITVKMVGLPIFSGEVRWTRPGRAGIRFLRPVPLDFLKEWVKAHGFRGR